MIKQLYCFHIGLSNAQKAENTAANRQRHSRFGNRKKRGRKDVSTEVEDSGLRLPLPSDNRLQNAFEQEVTETKTFYEQFVSSALGKESSTLKWSLPHCRCRAAFFHFVKLLCCQTGFGNHIATFFGEAVVQSVLIANANHISDFVPIII